MNIARVLLVAVLLLFGLGLLLTAYASSNGIWGFSRSEILPAVSGILAVLLIFTAVFGAFRLLARD